VLCHKAAVEFQVTDAYSCLRSVGLWVVGKEDKSI